MNDSTIMINVKAAADLTSEHESTVRRKIESGKYHASKTHGVNGTVYMVYVDSLPAEAQIKYYERIAGTEILPTGKGGADLVGYRERYGEAGLDELRKRQQAALAAHGIRMQYETNHYTGLVKAVEDLAAQMEIPTSTLLRWERMYAEQGLAGLMRKKRADAGESKSMCLLARDYIEFLMCDERKPPQTHVCDKVIAAAKERGAEACERCPYRMEAAERYDLMAEKGDGLPVCDQAGSGMIPPNNRHAVNRAVKQMDAGTLAYARYGSRYWEANYMQKTVREKPKKANECWFGDHHKLDLFVLGMDGKPVRPWMTAWQDAMSGAINGWLLGTEPNSDVVAESLRRTVSKTKDSPFYGLPQMLYLDNGKDYRSKRFEGETTGRHDDYDVGALNEEFCKNSMLQYLGIAVTHANPYSGWSKDIERAFGTLEKRWVRDFPGWCGDSPKERPQDLDRKIRKMIERGELMTFDTFADLFKRDIIDRYNNMRGVDGMTHTERYERAERARTDDPDWSIMAISKAMRSQRQVTYQGVRINNTRYQDAALAKLVGKEVTVLYERGANDSVTILYDGAFVCEAMPIETLKLIETDQEKLGRHMAMQRAQRKSVTGRIAQITQNVRGVHREAYAEEIDEQRDRAMARVGSLQAKKIADAKEEVARRKRRKNSGKECGAVQAMYDRIGGSALRRLNEG